ncbi:hypothetical protein Trydic_g10402 [Trypoxylus dichotomus]
MHQDQGQHQHYGSALSSVELTIGLYNITEERTHFYVVDNVTAAPLAVDSREDVIFFPKCCPPEYVFEFENRKCVHNYTYSAVYNDLSLNVSVVKSGLSNCEVIVDRRLSKLTLENFTQDRRFVYNGELFSYGDYCLDKLHDEENYIARLCYTREYCSRSFNDRKDWCLKKCCRDGYVLEGKRCILRPDVGLNVKDNLDVIERNDSIALFTDARACRMYEARKGQFNFSVKGDGGFLIFERRVWKEYKVDQLILKKIIQRIIVCYCFFLMLFYILTTLVHTIRDLGKYCEAIGFTLFFSYIASFAWMNILCFDIYRTVGSMKTSFVQSSSIAKKMACYSVYAISIPSGVTLFLYLANKQILKLPPSIYPKLLKGKCVIIKRGLGTYGHIVHSVIPVGILIAVNVVFFTKTIQYYLKAKSEVRRITGTSINGKNRKLMMNRQKIIIILKLSLVMGISWIFEIISLAVNFKQNKVLETIEAIIDTFNYLQGLFVFLIFLVKLQTLKDIPLRLKFNKVFKKTSARNYTCRAASVTTTGSVL